jgi:hypothetical protein
VQDGRPVAFESKKLNETKWRWPTHEMWVVIHCLKTWGHYIGSKDVLVWIDNVTLKYFAIQPKLSSKQVRWQNTLALFNVDIQPKSEPWWALWVHVCMWLVCVCMCLVRAPKVLQLCTNQFLVWLVQVHVNNLLDSHLSSHLGAPTRPFSLKVLLAKERTHNSWSFHCFHLGLIVEFIKELGGVSSMHSWNES